jgi:hypothetical protein
MSTRVKGCRGVLFKQGEVVLRDGVYITDEDLQMKMEGVYVWPFRQLRMVLTRSVFLLRGGSTCRVTYGLAWR